MVKYTLVNPYIKGKAKTIFNAKSSDDAAQKAWNKLAKYIANPVPKFAFTLESGKNTLHHYIVKETVQDDVIDTEIVKLEIKNNKKFINHFRKQKQKFDKMSGGSYYDCDDVDDDKYSFPIYPYMSQEISYLWYYPLMYRLGNMFLPTFIPQVHPVVYLDLPLFIYK